MRDWKMRKKSGKKSTLCALTMILLSACSGMAVAHPAMQEETERVALEAAFESSKMAALAGTESSEHIKEHTELLGMLEDMEKEQALSEMVTEDVRKEKEQEYEYEYEEYEDCEYEEDEEWSAYGKLRLENQGRLAERQRFICSTKPAVIFTFGGLSKEEPLLEILEEMNAQNMRGTFFVTERELQRNKRNIDYVCEYGQELGIGLRPEEGATFDDYCAQIERIRDELANYGEDTNVVRQMAGAISDEDEALIKEAVSAMGCILVGQGFNAVQSKHKDAQSAEAIMPDLFGRWTTSFNRGEIIYMRMDYYTKPSLAVELLRTLKAQKLDNIAYTTHSLPAEREKELAASAYSVSSVLDVLRDTDHLYTYPVDVTTLPDDIRPYTTEEKLSGEELTQEFYKRYVGAPEVGSGNANRMLGFSREEVRRADKTGIVKSAAENMVFFTFDDWGSDDSINHLLVVLKKHNVAGTFFIITKNIHNNPNLVRAIVRSGNEIGSHTETHTPMCIEKRYTKHAIMNEEEYDFDVRTSYEKLALTMGDMKLPSGRYALTRILRPPTLAISRMGIMCIFRNGFSYVVNGSGSTEDYDAVTIESLVGILHRLTHEDDGSVKRGAVLVMHMSATAMRTAPALDMLLTANDLLPEGHPGKFKVGLLGDYLVDDYDQRMKQVPPLKGKIKNPF